MFLIYLPFLQTWILSQQTDDSGPVGASVNISGIGFDPDATVNITFNGSTVDTTPAIVKTTTNGFFSANFIEPSPVGIATVIATQGSNSDSKTFTVTLGSTSLATTSQSSPNLSENIILPDLSG